MSVSNCIFINLICVYILKNILMNQMAAVATRGRFCDGPISGFD